MEAIYQGYFSAANQGKILCIGMNYLAHNAELSYMGLKNNLPTEPLWFEKPLSTLLLSGQTFTLQPGILKDIHHEVEVGIVIGMRGRNIKPENALHHIAGYFIGLDFTNRIL